MARRSGLLLCGLVSVLAHAALLGWGGQPGAGARRVDTTAKVRTVQLTSARPSPPLTPAELVADSSAFAVHSEAISPLVALQSLTHLSTPFFDVPDVSLEGGLDLESPSVPAGRPELFSEDGYIPRPQLTVVPVAQQTLVLEWPAEGAPPAGRYSGVVNLYIDEQGIIQHVRFADDGLPESLKDQARSALATIRYSPGKVNDQIVKSRLRLELVFEAEPRVVTHGSRR